MSEDKDQNTEHSGKYMRSIRLTHDMAARLQAVCDHLGVNVGAYITQEIGRAVARDEVTLLAKNTQDNSMDMLTRFIQEIAKAQEQEHTQ